MRTSPRRTAPAGPPGHATWRRGLQRRVVALLGVVLVAGCGGDPPSVLEPASRAAERVEWLWWVLFWTSTVAVGVVCGFLAAAVRRRRPGAGGGYRPGDGGSDDAGDGGSDDETGDGARDQIGRTAGDDPMGPVDRRPVPWGGRFVVLAGVVVPGVVLAGTFVVSLFVLDDLAAPSEDPTLRVEVVSRNWWWEVRYPDGAVTANEIHIPVGQPVEVDLPTADVIHSFWVPELQVKEDHVPGTVNRLWLEADRPGRYRGQCAEFCGLQHAHMEFLVQAQPPDEFEDWLAHQERPADDPEAREAERGRDVFMASSCAGCHTIRGTVAHGDLGPDLTHLASRETIGAGLMPLTPANLADFSANPQDDKPGVAMPPTELSPDEVDAVVAYLMELE